MCSKNKNPRLGECAAEGFFRCWWACDHGDVFDDDVVFVCQGFGRIHPDAQIIKGSLLCAIKTDL